MSLNWSYAREKTEYSAHEVSRKPLWRNHIADSAIYQ